MVTAPPAPKLIPKGMFSCGFWTEVLLLKYLHAMPLNRMISMLEMKGLTVSAGTLCGGLQKIEPLLRPLYQRLVAHCRSARHWHMDETRWMVFAELAEKKGYRWWLWVVLSDEACVYILDPSRSAAVPKNFLGEDAEGHLSVDRYSAYKTLSKSIKLAWCWAHVRRDFIDIGKSHKKLLLWSEQWVERIGELYHMNKQRVRNTPGAEQFMFFDNALREALGEMERKREKELARPALHKAKRKALTSMRRHWKGLLVFVERPEIPMDNNPAERALRNGVLGRKNYYGSGSIQSGMLSVMLFSIIQTALRNNVNPERYLLNYFEACAHNGGQPPSNLEEFDPWNLPTERKTQWRMKQPTPRGDTADGISHPRKWNESGDSSPPVRRSIARNSLAGSVRNSGGAAPMEG
jgi:transposase